ncbi:hypothetical protein COB55_03435 [Candidatus Wolfebacteria bacterium]|nr:MAG: hypothetical protein COB55_03435 [Candidatus Wolfebacteria bacterium]
MNTKICTKCKIEKELSEFHKYKNSADGHRWQCKTCRSTAKPKEILPEGMKRCSNQDCNEIKPLDEFYKGQSNCIECYKLKNEQYYKDNCEQIKKVTKEYAENHQEEIKTYRKQYRIDNVDKLKEKSKKHYKEHKEESSIKSAEYYQKNKERIKENVREYNRNNRDKINFRRRELRKNDSLFNLREAIGRMVRKTLKLIGTMKKGKSVDYVGYTPEQLMLRLEMNFTKYMNWDNYGTYWEIDHIISIDYFLKKGQKNPKIINALSNLQPLTCDENRSKGNKLIIK